MDRKVGGYEEWKMKSPGGKFLFIMISHDGNELSSHTSRYLVLFGVDSVAKVAIL